MKRKRLRDAGVGGERCTDIVIVVVTGGGVGGERDRCMDVVVVVTGGGGLEREIDRWWWWQRDRYAWMLLLLSLVVS